VVGFDIRKGKLNARSPLVFMGKIVFDLLFQVGQVLGLVGHEARDVETLNSGVDKESATT
jgi:hypothetical protein